MGAKYSTVTVTGYNASPPPSDASQSAANLVSWATIKTKLPDPLNTAIAAIDTALVAAFNYAVNQKTSDYTTVAADHMRTVELAPTVSSAVTFSLGDAASMTNNYLVRIKNSSTSAALLVTRITPGDTIDGAAVDITLASGQGVWVGTNSSADGYVVLAGINYSQGNHTGNAQVSGTALVPTGTTVPVNGLYRIGVGNPGIAANSTLAIDITENRSRFTGTVIPQSYTVAGLPSAAGVAGAMAFVTNEAGGAVPAFSDGTNWRRVTDRTVVS